MPTPLLLFSIGDENPRYALKEVYARLHVERMEEKRQWTRYRTEIGVVALILLVFIAANHTSEVLASNDLSTTVANSTKLDINQSVSSPIESLGVNQTLTVPGTIFQKILSNANQSLNALENMDMEIAKQKIGLVYDDLKGIAENSNTSRG